MDVSHNAFDHFCVIFFIFSKMCQRVSAIRAVLVTSHCGPTYNGGGPVDVSHNAFDHFWEHVTLMHLCFSVRATNALFFSGSEFNSNLHFSRPH